MEPRRSSDPPPDRLARLLTDVRGEVGRGGVPSDDGATLEDLLDRDAGEGRASDVGVRRGGRHRRGGVPFLSVPASLRWADLAVGSRAVRGLLVLVVVTALVLVGRWVWAQRPAEALAGQRVVEEVAEGEGAQEGVDQADAGADRTAAPGSGEGADGPVEAVPEDLVVHVTGQVKEPGVVELPAGSRVVDAVRAAGGLTEEADQSSVNLARALVDGEQLWVGRPGEDPPAGWSPPETAAGGGAGSTTGTGAGTQAPPLDLNSATQADLEELPGVGPVTAGHILAWREEHGRFSRVDELLEVSGIGERTLAQLEPLVTVGG